MLALSETAAIAVGGAHENIVSAARIVPGVISPVAAIDAAHIIVRRKMKLPIR